MKNIVNKYYNQKFYTNISKELFKDNENVSVVIVTLEDDLIKDIKFVSVKEGTKSSQVLPLRDYIFNDGRCYIMLVNHPSGRLSISPENLALYKASKNITSNFDLLQVSKDRGVFVSIKHTLKVLEGIF